MRRSIDDRDISTANQLCNIILQLPIEPQERHSAVICDLCGVGGYRGPSYKCVVCDDWDYCAQCYCLGRHSRNHIQLKMNTRNYQIYLSRIRTISHDAARTKINEDSKTHFGFDCAGCGLSPIHGVRYLCFSCGESNLCQKCESKHNHNHLFFKFRHPFATLENISPSLIGYKGVVHPDAIRIPKFFPTCTKIIPNYLQIYGEGKWQLFICGPPTDFKDLQLIITLTKSDDQLQDPDIVIFTGKLFTQQVKYRFKKDLMEISPFISYAQRRDDGYVGWMVRPDLVFVMTKCPNDPEEKDFSFRQLNHNPYF